MQKFSICRLNQLERGNIPTKVWCLKRFICADLPDEQVALIISSLISFLSLQSNEFLQSEIKQKFILVPKITCITAIADKKIINVFCASEVLYSPPQSAVQIK